MRLTDFRATSFRNVIDSGDIPVQREVTCLVGKNESGKTALLQALARLNPARPASFDLEEHYPRWLLSRHRKKGTAQEANPIAGTFALDDDDVAAVDDVLGAGVLRSRQITITKGYDNTPRWSLDLDETCAVAHLLDVAKLTGEDRARLGDVRTLPALATATQAWQDEPGETQDESAKARAAALQAAMTKRYADKTFRTRASALLWRRVPKFFYFSDYSTLEGRIDLRRFENERSDPAADSLQTARALLELAGTDMSRIQEDEYETRKAELEAVSEDLSREVFTYWKQNDQLEVAIDIDKITETVPHARGGVNATAVARHLDIRVRDRRHGYTNNFGQRSSGFQWFFSFLAAFSEFEDYDEPIIVLLDEPALTLHGRAQGDFLAFIDDRLATEHQVLYTTHSPFMIQPGRLDRVRIVEDQGPDKGAVVTTDALAVDPDSAFPIQGALGYDIAQNLFIGPHNLLVEGTSDLTYLTVISDFLRSQKRTGLDERWRIAPAGGAQNIPAFVALLGQHLDVTVLVDAGTEGMQRLYDLTRRGLLPEQRLVTVAEITETKRADMEDLFEPADYISLYNAALKKRVNESKLGPGDRIVKRIAAHRNEDFDHGLPADHLLRNRDTVLPTLAPATLDRFERLIVRLNQTLEP